ncbi:anaerobic carbon-monoxide dehydrogenase catalytic subunit [Candidatus Symbiopectobacterium sp. NZEC135]|uniref:anaerobic carbon-monoxide dehydrogenase catalytic subunit n=1 Tax=Candidatus Symbiopectobacterium sp. NZEC135 TaxID=2820471 RepID=UPI002226F559|nr:anaerobic carbon-monoxide dehydrogenase catalytic subunit [Candidatus Symbiopectobacterium sp. NZEC135]MCW2479341.1 anaerobic carbon-monoxide dehydrogenase catalytic subunit [Candidatus Symbiopectobacterium sp. NZEC135]
MEIKTRTSDPATIALCPVAEHEGIATVFDRHQMQQPQCGFGSLGLCCRICWKGPCRVDPFGDGPQYGICGATKDTIVARNLIRMMAAGAAGHSEHGRHIALAMQRVGKGELPDYQIRDPKKLAAVAKRLAIDVEGRTTREIAYDVATKTLEDYQNQDSKKPCHWLNASLPAKRLSLLSKLGVLPHNIDATVAQIMSRTHIGCDADPTNLVLGGIRGALSDFDGMVLATELSDAMFGTPTPVVTQANIGVIKKQAVNIAVNGHNPLLSEVICDVAGEMQSIARDAGASEGINIVGICCTGNEVMMRHGIPLATNYLSQEMAIFTGALDAMVVDVQCIMPSLSPISECYHTEFITTADENKIPGARHVSFHEEHARETARKIVQYAIDAYGRRDATRIKIPDIKQTAVVGFSTEAVMDALAALNPDDPLAPLVENIANGNILGVALFAGCNTTRVKQDDSFQTIAKILARNNVLMLATGCGAGAFAKNGLMNSQATESWAGDSLKAVLTAVGVAAGLEGPLPLVLHMGSCVDNSRAVMLATALAEKLNVDLSDLPLVASAPEAMSEKAIAIASWSVALGLPTHLGVVPHVTGSQQVTDLITTQAKDLFGGYFLVETDPALAAEKLVAVMKEKRHALGI